LIQLIAIVCFVVWFRKNLKKEFANDKKKTITLDNGFKTDEGSREDYQRAYIGSPERQPYGHWQDLNGGGDR
jgi:hypothetical protein